MSASFLFFFLILFLFSFHFLCPFLFLSLILFLFLFLFLFLLPIPDPIFHAPDEYSEFPLPVLQNRVEFVIFEKRTSVRGLIGGSRAGRQCCDLAAAGSAGREGAGRQTGWITDRRAD